MTTMRVAQITRPGGAFELVERQIPEPAAGQVRIKIQACGICHSDSLVKEGQWPGIQYPRVPGHEITGTIDAIGEGVTGRWLSRAATTRSRWPGSWVRRFISIASRKIPQPS